MAKSHKGHFVPSNPKKYCASNIRNIFYRSSWEQSMMMELDCNPGVINWASEAIKIPYFNPYSRIGNRIGNQTYYVPDFFVHYIDNNNAEHKELIEIKPSREVPGFSGKVSKLVEARQTLNILKWRAAMIFCAARGWYFRIATEIEMFTFNRKAAQ